MLTQHHRLIDGQQFRDILRQRGYSGVIGCGPFIALWLIVHAAQLVTW